MKTCTACKRSLPLTSFNKGNDKLRLQYKCKECLHQYRVDHINHINAYMVINKERKRASEKAWKDANLDRKRMTENKRRARQALATIEPVPTDIWLQMLKFYGERCMVPDCTKMNLTLDHVVPIIAGGSHAISNFQILCKSHNSSKGSHHSTDYRPKDDLGRPIILQNF